MGSQPPLTVLLFASVFLIHLSAPPVRSQERFTVSYAALGGANAIWNIAKETGFYKKHGLDVDVVFIDSSTISAAAVLSGHIQVGMVAGSAVINATASGADLVSVACFVNVLDFDLVVPASVKSAEDLKGKSIGISRFGSVTDVAARAFLAELKLRPGDDVIIRQIGGIPERAMAFKQGVVAGYLPTSGGIHLLGEALPHNVLLRMGDLKNPPPFPFICATTTKSYLAKKRENVKRVVMALTEAAHHFKTNKENTKKIIGKFFPTATAAYLEDNYIGTRKSWSGFLM